MALHEQEASRLGRKTGSCGFDLDSLSEPQSLEYQFEGVACREGEASWAAYRQEEAVEAGTQAYRHRSSWEEVASIDSCQNQYLDCKEVESNYRQRHDETVLFREGSQGLSCRNSRAKQQLLLLRACNRYFFLWQSR
jgi:hypothetical protein